MTEAQWLACDDPGPMLEFLRGRASERKLRLFGCATCRDLDPSLSASEAARVAVAVVERYVDGEATRAELDAACAAAREATYAYFRQRALTGQPDSIEERRVAMLARIARWAAEGRHPVGEMRVAVVANDPNCWESVGVEGRWRRLVRLLREVFGNPFGPATCDPAWRTPDAVALAQAAYDERHLPAGTLDAARLAVLADALEGAGCSDRAMLSHLREPGPHVRGCWVVDLILDRQ
jgi:hypothetical protein